MDLVRVVLELSLIPLGLVTLGFMYMSIKLFLMDQDEYKSPSRRSKERVDFEKLARMFKSREV